MFTEVTALAAQFSWLNEPKSWSGNAAALKLRTEPDTDFWRETFYGFIRDSGHAYSCPVAGDFTAQATVLGAYADLYDQAGLFFRLDEQNWIKAGIEYTDGIMHFSVVVTRGVSDWSVIPLPSARPTDPVRVRLTRHGDAVRVQYAAKNEKNSDMAWQMARLCPFPAADAQVGVMACSPQGPGFDASFSGFAVGEAIPRDLHAE